MEGRLLLAADYGDAPDTYGTSIAAGGAYHESATWFLGATRDTEADGAPTAFADGDGADEDGVTFSPLRAGVEAVARVFVTQPSSSNPPVLKLDAWIDFDGDGTFSGALERIATGVAVSAGQNFLQFNIPSDAAQGTTYARFRLSSTGSTGPRGNGGLGEVEDYAVQIQAPNAGSGNFLEQLIVNGNKGASSLYPVDMDRDGDLDLVVNDVDLRQITWHRNDGGKFTQLTTNANGLNSRVLAADYNSDGQMDILVVRSGSTATWVWKTTSGVYAQTSLIDGRAAVPADMAKDGRLDMLVAGANPQIFRILRDSSTVSPTNAATGTAPATAVDAADVDGDGDIDFIGGTAGDNTIAWYEYLSAQAGYARRVISTDVSGVSSASLVDFDHDGDLDVLTYAPGDGEIEWFENNGAQSFTRHLLATISGVVELNHADVDGDGDFDLLVAAGAAGAKLLTNDGQQAFAESTLPTSSLVGIQTIAAGDFDGDGILEIAVGGSSGTANGTGYLALLRRQATLDFGDAPASYGTTLAQNGARHYPVGPTLGPGRDTEIDGGSPSTEDGADEDGVTFGELQVGDSAASIIVKVQNAPAGAQLDAWIDFDGDGTFNATNERIATSRVVTDGDNAMMFAIPADAASGSTYARFRLTRAGGTLGPLGAAVDGEVEDYEVTISPPGSDGGLFGSRTSLTAGTSGTIVVAVDLDRDGKLDILSGTSPANWYRNTGNGEFVRQSITLTSYGLAESLQVADLDGDGDLDFLIKTPNILAWYENLGNQTFRSTQLSTAVSGALQPIIVDFDRDGDVDIVLAGSSNQGVQIIENVGGRTFAARQLFAFGTGVNFSRVTAVAVADADGDGLLDVYVAPDHYTTQLMLYRNAGNGTFSGTVIVSSAFSNSDRTRMLTPIDFDGDGDVDLAMTFADYAGYDRSVGWYENRGNGEVDYRLVAEGLGQSRQTVVADVDGDGDFDFVTSYLAYERVYWHENVGNGLFIARLVTADLTRAGNFPTGIALGDFDGDSDLDVAFSSQLTSAVGWVRQIAAATADYGDAPFPYPVTASANGPTHLATGPRLGNERDIEQAADNSPIGAGDGPDDDGVTFAPFRIGQFGATLTVNLQNAPAGAKLDAWIDFDGDGNWSRTEERIAASFALVEGDNVIAFDVPAWAMAGASYARFRVSTAGGLGYIGAAIDGEVEDYAVAISPPAPAIGPFFERHAIDESYRGSGNDSVVVDLDGDGDNDVVINTYTPYGLLWYDNDGAGQFTVRALEGTTGVISSFATLGAADVDLDGDVDLVARDVSGSSVNWFANNGSQIFTPRTVRGYSADPNLRDFVLADVEGDGDVDLLGAGQWSPNLATASSGLLPFYPSGNSTYATAFADVDRNGFLDVLIGSRFSSDFNLGSAQFVINGFTQPNVLPGFKETIRYISAVDLDQDGDLDLILNVSNAAEGLVWMENDGRMGYTRRVIDAGSQNQPYALIAADVDGDGDLDVLTSNSGETAWFENDGSEAFVKHLVMNEGGQASMADMNGDGKLDLVVNFSSSFTAAKYGLAWYSLTDRQISLTAAPSAINEASGESIVFTFTRAGNLTGEITVPFTVGGGAAFGVDYTVTGAASFDATSGTITFADGVDVVEVIVTPIDDAVKEMNEAVTLKIQPLAGHSIRTALAAATIITEELSGDYNNDGIVDGADFLAWQRGFGQSVEPVGSDADGNLDGDVDGDDLPVWTSNFGRVAPAVPPTEAAAPANVTAAPFVMAALIAEEEPAIGEAAASAKLTDTTQPWYGVLASGRGAIASASSASLSTVLPKRSTGQKHDAVDAAFAGLQGWAARRPLASTPTAQGWAARSMATESAEHSAEDEAGLDELAHEFAVEFSVAE
ncbi:FG-GAP-like repeat-containing protein [Lacipirellula sp.]|uniref:FG-GAP-like repeat-containing protein n=1 Tax=Lacipirellula sp. TaxID=2691419 RepID=UPI003D10D3C8